LRAAIAQRRREQRAGGGAGEHALGPQQLARTGEAFRVGDRIRLRDEGEIGIGRHEILADTFDRPASDFGHSSGLDIGREDRAFGIGEDHRGVGRSPPHEAADPGQRSTGADTDHDGIDITVHLAKNFRAGRRFVCLRIGRIGELIDEECARRALRDRLSEVLIVVGVPLADVRAGDDDLGAHRPGMQHLLACHLVRHHQQRAITLAGADQSETEPGIACGRFDDGAARLQPPFGLGRFDHGSRRPVLERARRIGAFKLEKEPARAAVDARHLDERCFADEVEDRGHGGV
jgi:hypothetical protein